jgi:hypothetical protein
MVPILPGLKIWGYFFSPGFIFANLLEQSVIPGQVGPVSFPDDIVETCGGGSTPYVPVRGIGKG